jgi:lactate/malate dehydrogenase, NAD binding domain
MACAPVTTGNPAIYISSDALHRHVDWYCDSRGNERPALTVASFSAQQTTSRMKVCVVGAAGGIGQPLSLLLKLSPLVDELSLYDVVPVVPGVLLDTGDSPRCRDPSVDLQSEVSHMAARFNVTEAWPFDICTVQLRRGLTRVAGVGVDLSHCSSKAKVSAHGKEALGQALTGCHLVIIPAGVPRKPGMTRDDLFNINAGIVKNICQRVANVRRSPFLWLDCAVMNRFHGDHWCSHLCAVWCGVIGWEVANVPRSSRRSARTRGLRSSQTR